MSNRVAAKESHVDVLIVGAGPAGVMACNALAKNGVNVRIVDIRWASRSPIRCTSGCSRCSTTPLLIHHCQTSESCRWPCGRSTTENTGGPQGIKLSKIFFQSTTLISMSIQQSYGLADKVFEKGNQMHMAVSLKVHRTHYCSRSLVFDVFYDTHRHFTTPAPAEA